MTDFELLNFENYVEKKILSRGFDYYQGNAIKKLSHDGELWKAKVIGSETYKVEVVLEDGQVEYTECSCPYEWGDMCKHVVAVLYAIRDELDEVPIFSSSETAQAPVAEIIDQMKPEEMRAFLRKVADEHGSIHNLIISSFGHYLNKNDKASYHRLIKSLVEHSYEGHEGYIEYQESKDLGNEIINILDGFRGRAEDHIDLCEVVIHELAKVFPHADDSNGYLGSAIDTAFGQLESLLTIEGEDPTEITELIFELALKEEKKKIYEYAGLEGQWRSLGMKAIRSRREADLLKKSFQRIEKEHIDQGKIDSFVYDNSIISQWQLLKDWGGPGEADTFLHKSLHVPKLREIALEQAFAKEEYHIVKQLAEEGIKLDGKKNYRGLVAKWHSWLVKLAEATHDTPFLLQLKEESYLSRPNLEDYRSIKTLLSREEFQAKLATWIEHFKKSSQRRGTYIRFPYPLADIYVEEKRLEDLMALLEAYPSLNYLDKYASLLAPTYAFELASLYNGLVRDYMEQYASGRADYKACCQHLNKVVQLGGLEQAQATVDIWRQEYKRRRALMEELGKLDWV